MRIPVEAIVSMMLRICRSPFSFAAFRSLRYSSTQSSRSSFLKEARCVLKVLIRQSSHPISWKNLFSAESMEFALLSLYFSRSICLKRITLLLSKCPFDPSHLLNVLTSRTYFSTVRELLSSSASFSVNNDIVCPSIQCSMIPSTNNLKAVLIYAFQMDKVLSWLWILHYIIILNYRENNVCLWCCSAI